MLIPGTYISRAPISRSAVRLISLAHHIACSYQSENSGKMSVEGAVLTASIRLFPTMKDSRRTELCIEAYRHIADQIELYHSPIGGTA